KLRSFPAQAGIRAKDRVPAFAGGRAGCQPRATRELSRGIMLIYTRNARIEWGDCDPAGIVFFPRYFAMFDSCTTALFSQALGMNKFQLFRHYKFAGYPMVDTR